MFFADLHIHSRFSRATAKSCDLQHLALWARKKGIAVLGSGDFTHPGWMAELREGLEPAEPGLYRLRPELERALGPQLPAACAGTTRFALSVEISTIYKQGERTRKVHHLILAPDFAAAQALTSRLAKIGNLASDGRPILGLGSRNLLEIVLESSPDCYLVPAHIWTPWFSALGAQSGFDSIAECYGDLSEHIFAVETGLSSDPAMNWRLSSLDRYRLVSSSDAHSPPMLGREACMFDGPCDYFAIRRALASGDGYLGTVEFFPEEGKYHLDGHRSCGVRLSPEETRELGGRCPSCGKPVTVGVLHRVNELADRAEAPAPPATAGQVRSLVPLCELLGELHGTSAKSLGVARSYETLLSRLGPELPLLAELPIAELRRGGSTLLAEAVERLRAGQVRREAGYDGQYGVIRLFAADELERRTAGRSLFEPAGPAPVEPAPPTARAPLEPSSTPSERPEALSEAGATAARALGPTPASLRTLPLFGAEELGRARGLLDGLDPDQRRAAEHGRGPLLIVAGPGSGKTRTLAHRVAQLITAHGAPAAGCLCITFTRRAAAELQQRLSQLLPEVGSEVPVYTFHRLGLSILSEHGTRLGLEPGFRIADQERATELMAEITALSPTRARKLLATVSRAKRTGEDADDPEIAYTLGIYRQALLSRQLVDFDDLVGLPAELLGADPELARSYRERYPWIAIDEYQDVDEPQYRLVKLLAPPEGNLCAIGDPDQAIYGFRGADVRFFQRFAQDFPTAQCVSLGRNYRSDGFIVAASAQVVAASDGLERALAAVRPSAERLRIHEAPTDRAEAEQVVCSIEQQLGGHSFFSLDTRRSDGRAEGQYSLSDFAVLYRTEAQAELLCEALRRSGLPFQRRSHDPLRADPLVRLLCDGLDAPSGDSVLHRLQVRAAALLQSEHAPPAADEATVAQTLERLTPLAQQAGADLGAFLADLALGCEIDSWDPRADRISLLTLHASKGLEFAVVFIVGCEEGLLPLCWSAASGAELAEERRLFYVGMTRARERLVLSHARQRTSRGQSRAVSPSPFLRDIEQALLERRAAELGGRRKDEPSAQLDLFS